MIKVLVFQQIGNPDGCTWYRLLQFTKEANSKRLADCQYLDLNLEEEQLQQVLKAADVFLVRLSPMLPAVLGQLAEFGIKKPVVLDIDDGIENINPLADHYRNMGTEEVKLKDGSWLWKDGVAGFDSARNRERVEAYKECLRKVDAVITTCVDLKNWLDGFGKPVCIIPNAINFKLFPKVKDPAKDEIRIVWSGGASHFADLDEIKFALARVMQAFPTTHFYMYGVAFGAIVKALPENRVHTDGWVQAEAHGYRLACLDADIALCPLIDSPFNRMKSSIKFYEMAALSVPTLARNIPPYSDDIINGESGLLYANEAEFEKKLTLLVRDPILRVKLGNGAYTYVKKNRELSDITKDWVEFLEAVA